MMVTRTHNFDIQGTGTAAPEIRVEGNGIEIINGDNTLSLADHTDFGSVDINTGSVVRTFTITYRSGRPHTDRNTKGSCGRNGWSISSRMQRPLLGSPLEAPPCR
jgi:hypothetical protein